MTDKRRSGVVESQTFHGGNPSLRPEGCCRYSIQRAFFLSAVVNRSSLRAHKERTDAESQRILGLCHGDTRSFRPVVRTRTFSPPRPYWRSEAFPLDVQNQEPGGKRKRSSVRNLVGRDLGKHDHHIDH
jgi:hypothetical protein